MQRTLLLTAALLAVGMTASPAQQATNDANPLYRASVYNHGTIVVPPIAGEPFSATAVIDSSRPCPMVRLRPFTMSI